MVVAGLTTGEPVKGASRLPQATQPWIVSPPGTPHRLRYPQRNCWSGRSAVSSRGYLSAESQCDGPVVEVREELGNRRNQKLSQPPTAPQSRRSELTSQIEAHTYIAQAIGHYCPKTKRGSCHDARACRPTDKRSGKDE
jgi:hypothetical protein